MSYEDFPDVRYNPVQGVDRLERELEALRARVDELEFELGRLTDD